MTRHQRTLTLSVLGVLLLGCGIRLLASNSPSSRQTLQRIKGIHVVVEDLDSDGLVTVGQVQTDTELRLRKAGINVLETGFPMLYVNTELLKGRSMATSGIYAYHIELTLEQAVLVPGNEEAALGATWSTGTTGMVGKDNLSKAIREDVGDLVDKFSNAYLSMNPKK